MTWTFTALDPTTLDLPMNPLVGFLPPNRNAPQGQGFVNYTVHPKATLSTGVRINAQATVVFDTNAPIDTGQMFNTIDAAPPTSTVAPLPAVRHQPDFRVRWSGSDDPGGSGIASYDVYVATDDGSFVLWLAGTTATSAVFYGSFGHRYSFYSVATDNVGNREATPAGAQAMTYLQPRNGEEDGPGHGRQPGESHPRTDALLFEVGTRDQANIPATYTLSNTRSARLLDSLFAHDADAYPVITRASVSDSIATLILPAVDDGFYLDPALDDTGLTLTTRPR